MPATTDIHVLANLREWTDANGLIHRHARGGNRPQAFNTTEDGGATWAPAMSPGPRPWTDALIVRAPATLAECQGPGSRLYRRSASRGERSFGQRIGDLRMRAEDALATDWTYSDDDGETWVSPN